MLDDLLIYAADLRSIAVTPERGTLGHSPTFLSLSKQALCWLRAKTGQRGPAANTPYTPMASQGLVTGWIKLSWISLAHVNSGQYPGAHVPCGARRAGFRRRVWDGQGEDVELRWRSAVVGISALWIEKHRDVSASHECCVLLSCTLDTYGHFRHLAGPQLPNENRTRYTMNIMKQQKGSQAACPVTHFSNAWKH